MNVISSQTPSTLVLSAPNGRWSARDGTPALQANTMNGVEAWVYALGGDYLGYNQAFARDIARYDLVIANSNLSYLPDFVRLAESRAPHTRWVMLIEGEASDYILLKPVVQRAFAVSDVINCINRHTLPLFQSLTRLSGSGGRAEYIGIPYPVNGVREYRVPIADRLQSSPRNLMLCPFLLTRSNDYAVAHALGQERQGSVTYYGYERRLSRKWGNWREFLENRSLRPDARTDRAVQLYADSRLEVRSSSGLDNFFLQNADAFFWLNLEPRFTWARYVLDAAALGIPIITTVSTGHGETLFPQTTLPDEYQIEAAIQLGRRLLDDAAFYRTVAEYAEERIETFSPEQCTSRLLNALYGNA